MFKPHQTISKKMYKLGLVGSGIKKSKSPEVYSTLIGKNVEYKLWDLAIAPTEIEIRSFLKSHNGLSITSPFKKSFEKCNIRYENPFEKRTKIINTLKIENDQIIATNTDHLACKKLFKIYDLKSAEQIIVLGSGAMAETLIDLLDSEDISYIQFSRKNDGNLSEVVLSDYKKSFFINCCHKNFHFKNTIHPSNTVWDMNYNHSIHQELFTKKKITYIDGRELLLEQAKFALGFWGISY